MEFHRYLTIFQDESREAMQQLNDQLLALERSQGRDPELLHAIFRTLHTFKGMAGTMGFDDLASLAHAMEELLDGLRAGAIALEPPLMDLLLAGVEALERMLERSGGAGHEVSAAYAGLPPVDEARLIERLAEAVSRTRVVSPPAKTPTGPLAPAGHEVSAATAGPAVHEAASGALFKVTVTLEEMCMLKSVRAMMIVSSLELVGSVLDITPSLEELEWSDDARAFELMLRAESDKEAIAELVRAVSEVEAVSVDELAEAREPRSTLAADAPPLTLEPAERDQLSGGLSVGFSAHRIEVTLMPDSLMKAVRATMVMQALEPFGTIVRLDPPLSELEEAASGDRFWVTTLSVAAPKALAGALENIGEVTDVAIRPLSLDEVARADGSAPEAAPAPIAAEEPDTANFQSASAPRRQTVRVSCEHLDALLGLVNELAADQARLQALGDRHGFAALGEIGEVIARMGALTGAVQSEVRALRTVPVEMVFNRFPRMIRNLSRELGKEVDLVMTGQETPLDRLVADELGDPLVHLLRNALDHGIESPAERLAAGKPPVGRLSLTARHEGASLVVEASDDGRGMDSEKLLAKAIARGLVSAAHAGALSPADAIDFVFAPGFSTAEAITSVSGRGVGLDVVRNKIAALGGAIEVDTRLGVGTTFRIRLPLSVSLVQAMLAGVGAEVYAIPMGCVETVLEPGAHLATELPLVRLGDRLSVPDAAPDAAAVVVVRTAHTRVGLVVEQLFGKHEITVKPLSRFLGDIRYLSGAAPLDDGRVALILDPGHLV